MGTRSLTYVYQSYKNDEGNKVNEPIMCMYRQYDGYPEGHGADLAKFLNSGRLVNGISMENKGRVFNGMGCLAAQLVAEFKDGAGGFYLQVPTLGRDDWQEYEYHVFDDKVIVYSIGSNNNNAIFEGSWADLNRFCNTNESKFDIDEDKDEVKSLLSSGELYISFEKLNGDLREMRCTLNEDLIPEASQVKSGKTRAVNDEVQAVYDLSEQHWKSFRWDSLQTYKVA